MELGADEDEGTMRRTEKLNKKNEIGGSKDAPFRRLEMSRDVKGGRLESLED